MAEKDKISPSAIKAIIEAREDVNSAKNSFPVIAKMLFDRFGIKVSPQAVRWQYLKNKDNEDILKIQNPSDNNLEILKSSQVVNLPATEEVKKEALNNVSSVPNKPVFNFRKNRQGNKGNMKTGFDRTAGDDLTSEDLARLFGKAVD